MISSALVTAIGRYSRQFPVNRIARSPSAAGADVYASMNKTPVPPSSRKLQRIELIGKCAADTPARGSPDVGEEPRADPPAIVGVTVEIAQQHALLVEEAPRESGKQAGPDEHAPPRAERH